MCNAVAKSDGDAKRYADCYADCDTQCHAQCYADRDSDGHGYTAPPHAQAAADSASAPDAVGE
jgi:hypothetical protein